MDIRHTITLALRMAALHYARDAARLIDFPFLAQQSHKDARHASELADRIDAHGLKSLADMEHA